MMEANRFPIVFINYFKNLCNLRNPWIKSLFGCGSAALSKSMSQILNGTIQNENRTVSRGRQAH